MQYQNGYALLHIAALEGHLHIVKYLFTDCNADPHQLSKVWISDSNVCNPHQLSKVWISDSNVHDKTRGDAGATCSFALGSVAFFVVCRREV